MVVVVVVVSTEYITGSVLISLPLLANLIFTQSYDLGTFIIPSLEMRKERSEDFYLPSLCLVNGRKRISTQSRCGVLIRTVSSNVRCSQELDLCIF